MIDWEKFAKENDLSVQEFQQAIFQAAAAIGLGLMEHTKDDAPVGCQVEFADETVEVIVRKVKGTTEH